MTLLPLLSLLSQVPVAPAVGPTWLQTLLGEATALLVPLLAGALFTLLIFGIRWLASKAKGSRFDHAVKVVTEATEGIVLRIKAKVMLKLAEVTAETSDGGKAITAAERAALLTEGVAALKAELPGPILAIVKGNVGNVDSWLAAKVESAILGSPSAAEILPPR